MSFFSSSFQQSDDKCGSAIDYARESDKKLNDIKVAQDINR
jgi:hypothetical protein